MATNIIFHPGAVGQEERADLLKQKGATVWLTGLSASGKVSRRHHTTSPHHLTTTPRITDLN